MLLALAAFVVLALGLRRVAQGPAGVTAVPIDSEWAIGKHLAGAGYADAYRTTIAPQRFADIDAVMDAAFQRGSLIEKNEQEVLYRGGAPGLVFHVTYRIAGEAAAPSLEMATVVHYRHWMGRFYFFFVRPVHRLGVPWMFKKMTHPEEE